MRDSWKAEIDKWVEDLNAEWGWQLPVPVEWTMDWFLTAAEEVPGGVYLALLTHMYARMPTKADLWGIRSLVESSYGTNLNPLAWIGEWYAERNLLVDPGYTRISMDPPEDVFYGIVPWAYQLIWRQLVWTWEPVWSHDTVI